MVAIVSGNNLGLALGSLATLGKWGSFGTAASGRGGEKAYVNVANGNFVLSDLDDRLAGVGLNVATLRTYNSQGALSGGWRVGPAQRVSLTGSLLMFGSSVTRTGADGSQSTYFYDSTQHIYISTDGDGAYDTIAYDYVNGQFVWKDGDTGLTEHYDGAGNGNLISSTDTTGNKVSYFYNGDNSIASVVSSSGETTYFDYANGDLTALRTVTTGTSGSTTSTLVRYQYDSNHRLTSVIVDLTPDDNSVTDGNIYRTDYTYDGSSNRISSVVQSDGTSLALGYVQIGSEYRVASVTDGLGNKTSYAYDTANLRTTIVDPMGQASVYAYDAQGQLLSVTGPAVGGVSSVRRFEYDSAGDVTRVIDENGNAIKFDYDGNGNLYRQTDALGNVITRTFDGNNQLLTETTALGFDSATGLATETSTVRYVYESTGRNQQRFVITPEGRVTEYVYDARGQRVSAIQYLGATYPVGNLDAGSSPTESTAAQWAANQDRTRILRTDMTYDMRGQLQTRITYQRTDASGVGIADGTQSIEQYVYDQHGQLLKTVNANSGVTLFAFDGLGRLIATTDAAGNTTSTFYDDANNRTVVTSANGVATSSTYDRAGHVTSVTQTVASGTVLGQTKYAYDADGRLLMTQDATGVRHWYTYDALGRKTADIDATGSVTEYRYDAVGNVIRTIGYATAIDTGGLTDASGNPTGTSLDAIRPAATAADTSNWRIYDADGRLSKTVTASGAVTEMRYDGAARLVATIQYVNRIGVSLLADMPSAADVNPTASSADRLTRNFYTKDNQLEATIDADGFMTYYTYDAAGRQRERVRYITPTDPALRASGDVLDLVPPATDGDIHSATIYDASGRIVGEMAGGYLTERVYDARGNVTKVIRYATPVSVGMDFNSTVAQLRPSSSAADQVVTTSYDALDRITRQVDPQGTVTTNTYDTLGNLINRTQAVGTSDVRTSLARYDVLGRLIMTLSAEGAAKITAGMTQEQIDAVWNKYSISYTYDAAGRRMSMTDALGNRTRYFYDGDGNLTFTVNALGEISARDYNALGQLVATTAYATRIQNFSAQGGVASDDVKALLTSLRNPTLDTRVTYAYNTDGTLASETNAAGGIVTHAYDAFGEETTRTTTNGAISQTKAFSYDRRGNLVSTSLDPAGLNITTRSEYDPFGRVIRSVDASGNATTYRYDDLGRQVQTTDALGNARSATYDAFGRVLTETDALGNVTKYAYNLTNRSTTVTTPDGVSVVTVVSRNGQTTKITDGRGYETIYKYDHDGNLLTTDDDIRQVVNKYDVAGHLIETDDPNGNAVKYTYDAAGRVLTRTVDAGGLNLVTRYAYDAKGQQITVTDANGTVTRTDYDNSGQIVARVVDVGGLNLTTGYSYDQVGNVLTVVSPDGVSTRYEYDATGRRIAETIDPTGLAITRRYTYDASGHVATATDGNGNVTRYFYDERGLLAYTVDPLGNVVGNVYDKDGQITAVVHYAQALAASEVATAGSSTATLTTLLHGSADDITERRVYDAAGHLKYTIDSTGAVVRLTYDKSGNVTERLAYATPIDLATWNGVGDPPAVTDPAHDQATRTVYDAIGRPIYIVDAYGALTTLKYDTNGNVTDKVVYAKPVPAGTAVTASALKSAITSLADAAHDVHERNVYDAANRLTWTVNGVGSVVRFVYDADGNVISQTRFANVVSATTSPSKVVASASDLVTRMTYDGANRLVYQVDAVGNVVRQRFDAQGRVIERQVYATPVAVSNLPADMAKMASLVRPDPLNDRITRSVYDAAGREIFNVDASGAVVEATYDALGHVVATRAYANRIDLNGFDPASGVDGVRVRLSADILNDRVSRSVYDADGRAIYQIDSLGFVTANTFDAFGRVVNRTLYGLAVSTNTPWTAQGVSAALVPSSSLDRTSVTTYDANGRILSTRDALGYTQSYTYDGLGNKRTYTNQKGSVWTYDYDAAGRLVAETSPQIDLTHLTYDANSNLVVDPAASGPGSVVTRTTYDALGRVIARTEAYGRPEARTTRYDYDAVGHQVKTTFPPVGVYDASRDNLTVNGANSLADRMENLTELSSQTVYDALGNAVANQDVAGNWSYKAYDTQGNVLYDIDALGYVTAYGRNAYGEVTTLTRYGSPIVVGNGAKAPSVSDVKTALSALPAGGAANRVITSVYDQLGHTVRVTEPQSLVYDSGAGGTAQYFMAGRTTQNVYNAFGELTQASTLRNAVTNQWTSTYQYYDQRGQQVGTVDAMGYVTAQAFDAAGNQTSHTEYATALTSGQWSLNAFGRPAASSDDRTVVTTYDALNRKTSEVKVDVQFSTASDGSATRGNLSTQYRYDAVGNLTTTIAADGGTSYNYFDALGRLVATTGPTRSSTLSGAALTPLNIYYRDAYGDAVMTVVRAQGAASANDSSYVDAGANAADQISTAAFDSHGKVIQLTDANGAQHYTSYDAAGRIAKEWQVVTGNDGASHTLFKAYQYDKLGRQTHIFDPASTSVISGGTVTEVSQSTAGLVDTAMEYNAFGEMTRRGVGGGRQEYFDYDNAGHVWRTNSGDGVDKVSVYNLDGRVTAEIRSAGSGGVNYDMKSFGSADQVVALSDGRRTDLVYDALGRVVSRSGPTRSETAGAVTVRSMATYFSTHTPQIGYDEDGKVVWNGSSSVSFSWSLAQLGSGDVRVEFDYTTASVPPSPVTGGSTDESGTDESGNPLSGASMTGVARTRSQIFTNEQAGNGVTISWAETNGTDGGIGHVDGVRVYKKDVNGNWQLVINQNPTLQTTNQIEIGLPSDTATHVTLQVRPAGSPGDSGWISPSGVNFGDAFRFDTSGLAAGAYEYRVLTTNSAGTTQVTGTGSLSVNPAQLANLSFPIGPAVAQSSPWQSSPKDFTWPSAPSDVTQLFRYRVAGGNGAWSTVPIMHPYSATFPTYDGFDMSSLAAGAYEYELLWQRQGESAPYAHATGSMTVVAAVADQWVPPVGMPVISNVWYAVGTIGGSSVVTADESGSGESGEIVGGHSASTLRWAVTQSAETTVFRYRVSGGNWQTLPVSSYFSSSDEAGSVTLEEAVDIGGLPVGTFEFEILRSPVGSSLGSHFTGNLTVSPAPAGHYETIQVRVEVPRTVTPPDPSNYVKYPIYDGTVFTNARDESGALLLAGDGRPYLQAHYQWSGNVAAAVPYDVPHTESRIEAYTYYVTVGTDPMYDENGNLRYNEDGSVMYANYHQEARTGYQSVDYTVWTTVWPDNPANHVIGYEYGPPVVVGRGENGETLYGPNYGMVNGQVVAIPYTVIDVHMEDQQVWVDGVAPPPSFVGTTPAYVPGYVIPGSPAQYGSNVTTGSVGNVVSVPAYGGAMSVSQTVGLNGGATATRPTTTQTYDRWGNVLSVTDPRSPYWVTTYKYNANNQIVEQRQPDADGNQSSASAVTRYTYDAMGRSVAVVDANGHVDGKTYDAAGNVTQELHADGGVVRNYYDAFGQKVRVVDANGNPTDYSYDKLGHVVQMTMGEVGVYAISGTTLVNQGTRALTQSYGYDQAGRKLWQRDGAGATISYAYDAHGNVVQTTQPLGQTVRAAFDAQNHKIGEVDGNGALSTWTYDYFGLLLGRTDIGGASYSYTYDNARQLIQTTSTRGQNIEYRYDGAGQNIAIIDNALSQVSTYAYDVAGNKVRERTVTNGVTYQDNHLAYDALGRLRDVADGRVHISIDYDAVGNRTHVTSHVINAMDQSQDEDRWYQYDAMNRQIVVDGINANGDIGVGQGHKITYDKNGNRTSDTYYGARVQADRVFDHTEWTSVWGVTGSDEAGNPTYGYIVQPSAAYSTQYTAMNGLTTEAYDYDSNNRLSHVSRDGVLLDTRFYDGANRVVQTGPAGTLPQEYVTALNGAAGGNGSETRQSTYDQNGRLLHQKVTKSDGAAKYEVNYSQYDGAGNVVSYSMANQDGDGYTNNYTYTMARFDGYKEARVDGTSDKFDPGSTTSDYDVNGNLVSVTDSTKPENNRTFVNDAQGHVLYVNQGGHTQRQLVVDGEVLGRYGDMINPDAPQDPNTGNPSFINKADFSFGFQPINGKYPTGAPGAIAVQAGDTLESIAHSAYGDSKLWYLIAEANGLSGNSDLRVGQSLTIPNRVSTIHNDSKTFKPYDPSQVIGDTTPNLPMPQADSGGGCGGLGTVIMIAVTVVVAIYTAGAAAYAMSAVQAAEGATAASLSFGSAMSAGASAMLGGTAVGGLTVTGATIGGLSAAVGAAAIGGIAGSLAGQLAGVAMGAQNGISFNQLALSGLSAAIGAGVGGQITGATIGASALRAAATNVALQGIGVVTGLQHSFNWTSVAASAAGGAVGGALNAGGANSISQSINNEIGGVLGRTVTGVLVGTAAGLTTSILRGGRVAMQQVATDAFGNALGQSVADAVGSDPIERMTEESTRSLTNRLAANGDGSVMFGPKYSLGMTAQGAMDAYGAQPNGGSPSGSMAGLFGTYSGYGVSPSEGEGDVMRDALVKAMQNPASLVGPRIVPDDFGNPINPDLVTGQSATGADGTPGLYATDAARNAYADALNRVKTMDVKPVFDATDPHQYLIFVADDGTRNDANQAIPTNPRTLYNLIDKSANAFPIYVGGVGTENDLGGLNSAFGLGVPLQVSQTLAKINDTINTISQADPDAKFVFTDTGFSRGSNVIRAVQNILVEQGVPDLSSAREVSDGEGGKKVLYDRQIIEPGKVNIGASMLYDTVTTGAGSLYNMLIPSQVQQTLHLTAANEYRTFFPLTSALSENGASNGSVVEIALPGAHTNIGGGSYDKNGIGAANLEIGYTYLQRAGVPLAPLPDNLRPDPLQFVIYDSRWVRDVSFGQLVNDPNVHRVTKYGQ